MTDIQTITLIIATTTILVGALARWNHERRRIEETDRQFSARLGPLA